MLTYQGFWKELLFTLDPEVAHYASADMLRLLASLPGGKAMISAVLGVPENQHPVEVAGLHFPNPVGLAAGFDKNAVLVNALEALGFGYAEVGTITPKPQKGNPRPRLFRLPEEKAVLNRMGFNNDGLEVIAQRLEKRRSGSLVIGGNIGKNKWTPNEEAVSDYLICFRRLRDLVDYFTINLSSPNTPGLRQLLEKESIRPILSQVMEENHSQGKSRPVFLKISPDLEPGQLRDLVEVCTEFELSGIVATNTTIRADLLKEPKQKEVLGAGGLSGALLREPGDHILEELVRLAPKTLAIVSSGGIMNPETASRRFSMGAKLIQLYSGLIYEGPGLPAAILRNLKN